MNNSQLKFNLTSTFCYALQYTWFEFTWTIPSSSFATKQRRFRRSEARNRKQRTDVRVARYNTAIVQPTLSADKTMLNWRRDSWNWTVGRGKRDWRVEWEDGVLRGKVEWRQVAEGRWNCGHGEWRQVAEGRWNCGHREWRQVAEGRWNCRHGVKTGGWR